MTICLLHPHDFRNLETAPLRFSPAVNLVVGDNGSGKSSLLEAIGILATGKSFRTSRREMMISHGQPEFTVYGEVARADRPELIARVGVRWHARERSMDVRVDAQSVRSVAEIARLLPLLVIDPDSFGLISGGPVRRRQYLDWLVFHVEPTYAQLWQRFQRALSQRNQILKSARMDAPQLRAWTGQYGELAQAVTDLRSGILTRTLPVLASLLDDSGIGWLRPGDLTLEYYPGWDKQQALLDVLMEHQSQELKQGFTLYGPARADIRLRYRNKPAAEVLSRGQQKTVVMLLRLVQGMLLASSAQRQAVFLLDDMYAELDEMNRIFLVERLARLGGQVIATGIERTGMQALWSREQAALRMFHVEHGRLIEE